MSRVQDEAHSPNNRYAIWLKGSMECWLRLINNKRMVQICQKTSRFLPNCIKKYVNVILWLCCLISAAYLYSQLDHYTQNLTKESINQERSWKLHIISQGTKLLIISSSKSHYKVHKDQFVQMACCKSIIFPKAWCDGFINRVIV